MPFNRREFLTGSSSLLALGALGALGTLGTLGVGAAPAEAMPAIPASGASELNGLERWLLETGRSSVDDDVYRLVAAGA